MTKVKYVFWARHHNDIDHVAPIIWGVIESGVPASEVRYIMLYPTPEVNPHRDKTLLFLKGLGVELETPHLQKRYHCILQRLTLWKEKNIFIKILVKCFKLLSYNYVIGIVPRNPRKWPNWDYSLKVVKETSAPAVFVFDRNDDVLSKKIIEKAKEKNIKCVSVTHGFALHKGLTGQEIPGNASVPKHRYFNIRPSKNIIHKHFINFASSLTKGKSILDIASSSFKNAGYFKDLNYIGCDMQEKRIKDGRKKFIDDNFMGVCGDMRKLCFKERSFDYIISTHSLSHLPNEADVIWAVWQFINTVKSGGKIFFNIIRGLSLERAIDSLLYANKLSFRKIGYRGAVSRIWEKLWADRYNFKIKNKLFKKILITISFMLSILDFIGYRNRLIYICEKEIKL
jgi:2-polyprenyl-3-methyl-5-hydroxy-6-metoxy-1,4-benzoquinol methylase